jgi:hypothetical protein
MKETENENLTDRIKKIVEKEGLSESHKQILERIKNSWGNVIMEFVHSTSYKIMLLKEKGIDIDINFTFDQDKLSKLSSDLLMAECDWKIPEKW